MWERMSVRPPQKLDPEPWEWCLDEDPDWFPTIAYSWDNVLAYLGGLKA